MKDKMRSILNRTFDEIRSREMPPEMIEESARRVWLRIKKEDEAEATEGAGGQLKGRASSHIIEGCADFRALIPAYLAHTLSEARALLLEDHARVCVACRQEIHRARFGSGDATASIPTPSRPRRRWRLALAASGIAAIAALIVIAAIEGVPPGLWTAKGVSATVESVSGSLYAISGQLSRPLSPGDQVNDGEEIRAAADSTAAIRLATGSHIELGMRADMTVTRGWFGTTIHLAQGSIIVDTSRRDSGHLSVATQNCVISDQGTIFAVSEGVKGSRVSVIQGLVRVKAGGQSQTIRAGGQLSTGSTLTKIPIREQISWSPDASRYLGLLGELAEMGRELQSMPSPPPRFHSRLIKYVPEDTLVYAAIPNLEPMLKQVDQIFQKHLAQSVLLSQWWQKQQASGSARIAEEVLKKVESGSSYLGNEIVLAAAERGASGELRPVVLARIKKAGFRKFLERQLSAVNPQNGQPAFRIVSNAAGLPSDSAKPHQIFFLIKSKVMAASSDPNALREIAALIGHRRSSRFSRTDFYSAIRKEYRSGAGWLLAVNLEQFSAQSVNKKQVAKVPRGAGLANVKYLFAESKDAGRKPENRVTITFAQGRQGPASWLAKPSPMGTLNFVSPEASFAFSFVLKDPKALIPELLARSGKGNSQLRQGLAAFESLTGVSIENDLAASLGGEVTVAQDGPLLPTPQWLVAMDAYNPRRLERSVQKLVQAFNENLGGVAGLLRLKQVKAGGSVYYDLHFEPAGKAAGQTPNGPRRLPDIHYTFADGYLLLAASQSALSRAIQNRETGYSLVSSPEFRKQLPEDGNAYFSAVLYENLGRKLNQLIEGLPAGRHLAPGSEPWAEELARRTTPVVIGAYSEPDRIMLVSNESPLGLGVNSILMAADAMVRMPQSRAPDRR